MPRTPPGRPAGSHPAARPAPPGGPAGPPDGPPNRPSNRPPSGAGHRPVRADARGRGPRVEPAHPCMAATAFASRGDAYSVPRTNRITGPKLAAAGSPVKYSPGTEEP